MLLFLVDREAAHNTAENDLIDVVAFEEVGFFLEDELDHVLGFGDDFGLDMGLAADLFDAVLGAGD